MNKEERIKKYEEFSKIIERMEKDLHILSDEFRSKLLENTKHSREEQTHVFSGSSLVCPISLLLTELGSHIGHALIEAKYLK